MSSIKDVLLLILKDDLESTSFLKSDYRITTELKATIKTSSSETFRFIFSEKNTIW